MTGWEDWWFYHALSPPALIPGNSPAQNRAERLGSDNLYTAEAAHTPGTHPVHCPFSNEKSLQAARPLQAVRSRQDLSLPSPPIFTRYSVLYSCYLLLALKTGLLFTFSPFSLPWFFKRRNTVLCHLKLNIWNMLLTIDTQCLEEHQCVSFLLLHCELP